MKFCVLTGSPRENGNTAALLAPFLDECRKLGVELQVIPLRDRDVRPCLGCRSCQDCLDGPGCVQEDGFAEIFSAMSASDVIVLATPIYAFFCTAPMKALMDRAIYAGTKNYGREKGPRLLAGRRAATVVTCGYRPERGADLWEEGLKRWCRHGGLEYLGILCRRDHGGTGPFMNEEREQAARDFAQALYLALRADQMAELTGKEGRP